MHKILWQYLCAQATDEAQNKDGCLPLILPTLAIPRAPSCHHLSRLTQRACLSLNCDLVLDACVRRMLKILHLQQQAKSDCLGASNFQSCPSIGMHVFQDAKHSQHSENNQKRMNCHGSLLDPARWLMRYGESTMQHCAWT